MSRSHPSQAVSQPREVDIMQMRSALTGWISIGTICMRNRFVEQIFSSVDFTKAAVEVQRALLVHFIFTAI